MSALGVKRTFDIFASRHDPIESIRSTACSPHRIQFLSQEHKQQHQQQHALSFQQQHQHQQDVDIDPHNNSGSIGFKRFRRTEAGDYDIVTVTGEDVHMDTKSPPYDGNTSPKTSATSTSISTCTSSSSTYRTTREPSAFTQASSTSTLEPFANLDGILQQAAATRAKRQRPRDDTETDAKSAEPLAKKVATSTSMPQLHTETTTTPTATSTSTSSSSSTATPTPGISSLGVLSSTTSSSSSSSSSCRPPSSTSTSTSTSTSQPLFTLTQVRKIVEQALAQQKEMLIQEYDGILNDKLREQFENFSSFNRDYISRQLSKGDFSYLS